MDLKKYQEYLPNPGLFVTVLVLGILTVIGMEMIALYQERCCSADCKRSGYVTGDLRTSGCVCYSKEYMNAINKDEIDFRRNSQ